MGQQHLYDMISDTATVPTDEMFDLMKLASRGDDVYSADESVKELEDYVAQLLGHEAGLFGVSGTMTNQLGLRCLLTQPPHSVLCDARAHIYIHECGGLSYHSQASITPVHPHNGAYLTLEDVKANIVTDDLCGALTKVVALENTLNGTILPFDEMKAICDYVHDQGLYTHLDGARLWNASQATGVPLHEYGKLFDTVSVCLSKGVGAPIGSMLVGSASLIRRARHLRKLMGGGWRQAGMLAHLAKHCITHVVPTMPQTHAFAARLATELQRLGFLLTLPCETNMVFIDTRRVGFSTETLANRLRGNGILISGSQSTQTRIVLHYQITEQAIDTFVRVATSLVNEHKDVAASTVDSHPLTEKVREISSSVPYPTNPKKHVMAAVATTTA